MYRPKAPKSQQSDKTPYTAYNPHSVRLTDDRWDDYDYYRVVSIDPGTKNFAIRVEKRPKIADDFQIKTELYERLRLTDGVDEEMQCSIYTVLTDFLDEHLHLFLDCHYIIIERQLMQNYRTVRISQHVLTYFMIKLKDKPSLPIILEIDPKLKGKQLGAPKGITERQLKQWSVEKATELLGWRGDSLALDKLKKSKTKADDLADTVCQIEAVFSYLGLPVTLPPVKLELPTVDSGVQPSSKSLSEYLATGEKTVSIIPSNCPIQVTLPRLTLTR